MKIAVIGEGFGGKKEILEKAKEIGREIAKKKATLMTGNCLGYPHAAVKGAFEEKGNIIGISPAKDKEEHIAVYNFPYEVFSEIKYTGLGIPGRNLPLVKEADAVILIGGGIGSLNEFTIAFHFSKVIGVLKDSGGVTEIIEKIVEVCDKKDGRDKLVIYDENPKRLIEKTINLFKNKV